jgi:preprotein translocase subunit SecD
MDLVRRRFNTYLLSLLCVASLCGCITTGSKKKSEETVLRVHAEARDNSSFTRKVTVLRTSPVDMVVDQSPILTDEEVADARVVEALGGFAIQIKFDSRGQWLLDHHTSLNLGRHLAIFVSYGGKKNTKSRWLAAPIISQRVSDGMLIFTPDATREEADEIVLGLKSDEPDKAADADTDKNKDKETPEK